MDSTLRRTKIHNDASIPIISQLADTPKHMGCDEKGTAAILFSDCIRLFRKGIVESQLPLSFSPASLAISRTGKLIAVGSDDGMLHLFTVLGGQNDSISMQSLDVCRSPTKAALKSLSFNRDGTMLAIGDATSSVLIFDIEHRQFDENNWIFHTARINSVAWSPSQRLIASGSLDTHIYVWSLDKPGSRICIRRAHRDSVLSVVFLAENLLASTGQDACLKIWMINNK
jgi:WD repeat-containing protein 1 (actin-interacting protein 1)